MLPLDTHNLIEAHCRANFAVGDIGMVLRIRRRSGPPGFLAAVDPSPGFTDPGFGVCLHDKGLAKVAAFTSYLCPPLARRPPVYGRHEPSFPTTTSDAISIHTTSRSERKHRESSGTFEKHCESKSASIALMLQYF